MTSMLQEQRSSTRELSAGALLRQAREAQGLHLETLANIVKMPAKKLEALEADRFEELHDAAFVRALVQTVCRALKTDPAPVLARLPEGRRYSIEKVSQGLNTPFRERELRPDAAALNLLQRPFVWAAGAIVVAAIVVFLLPVDLQMPELFPSNGKTEPSAGAAPAQSPTPGLVTETITPTEPAASAPVLADALPAAPAADAAASAPTAAAAGDAALVLHAKSASWIEVIDRNGQSLIARTLSAGDSVGIDGALPMRVKIGNAAATEITFRGENLDLAPMTRDNVARFELK